MICYDNLQIKVTRYNNLQKKRKVVQQPRNVEAGNSRNIKMQKKTMQCKKNEDPHVWQKLGGSSRPPPSVSRNANIDLLVIFFHVFSYSVSVCVF